MLCGVMSKSVQINPNDLRNYITYEKMMEVEETYKITTNLSEISYLIWTRKTGIDNPISIQVTDGKMSIRHTIKVYYCMFQGHSVQMHSRNCY